MLINAEKLKEIINNATLSTAKEKDSPLHNTLIKIKNNKLEVISANNITQLIQQTKINFQREAEFVIDTQKLSSILREINQDKIDLIIDEKTLTIKTENFKSTIKIHDKNIFPEITINKEFQKVGEIEAQKVKKLIKGTIYCPDRNDIAREYTGIYFEVTQNKIKATATDHYRLINIETSYQPKYETDFIIENAGANLISKLNFEGKVAILKAGDSIEVKSEDKTVISKLIKGQFPDYNQILLNQETSSVISLDTGDFKDTIKRSSILSQEVTMEIDTNKKNLTVKSQNSEGETAQGLLGIENIKPEANLIIKLDSKFILDFLNSIKSEKIELLYKTGEEPVMFIGEEKDFKYNYIMTPIIE